MSESARGCTCRRGLPPRGWGYRPAPPCPHHGKPVRATPPRPPSGPGGGEQKPMCARCAENDVAECQHDWLDRPESDTRECLICGVEA